MKTYSEVINATAETLIEEYRVNEGLEYHWQTIKRVHEKIAFAATILSTTFDKSWKDVEMDLVLEFRMSLADA